MTETTTGVIIAELTPTSTLAPTDRFELDRNGEAYSITYEAICIQLQESLGMNELIDGLTKIIG